MKFKHSMISAALVLTPILANANGGYHPVNSAQTYGTVVNAWGAKPTIAVAEKYVGKGNVTGFNGPWCGAFVAKVLHEAGYHAKGSLRAIDNVRAGRRVTHPEFGDLVVFERHVGFFEGFDSSGAVLVLGGNQRHNVNVSRFASNSVVAYVEPM